MATQDSQRKSSLCDVAVVGSGLLGLLAARLLADRGLKVAVLEVRAQAAGHLNQVLWPQGKAPADLRWLSANETELENIRWLCDELDLACDLSQEALAPLTFNEGELKTFLGFGEAKYKSADILTEFSSPTRTTAHFCAEDWIAELLKEPKFELRFFNELTDILPTESGYQLTINASTQLMAKDVVFTASPRQLENLIQGEALSGKTRQKLARAPGWSALFLHFLHREATPETTAMHILTGGQTEFEPCVGRFFPQMNASVWMSPVPLEMGEDMDHISALMKNMKRQIKRAYPQALDAVAAEKIRLLPDIIGPMGLKLEHSQLPELPRLYLVSSLSESNWSWLAGLSSLRETVESISTPKTEIKTTSPEPEASL